ncbi:MAG TPA: caspase family protein [Aeromonadales bacterium]|nr:caspase family protein [Aeromonadales bacterium]
MPTLQMMKKQLQQLIFIIILLTSLPVVSADKALIIGVDAYENGLIPLMGVTKDIKMMQQVAQIMGFESSQTTLLTNQDATLSGVRQAMAQLVDSTGANDRVLIYFSGHGSQILDLNQDEDDGADEVLLLSNSQVNRQGSENTLTNVLVDDEFQQMLTAFASRQVIAIIDTCHSGTIHKALTLNPLAKQTQQKLFRYKGMPTGQKQYTRKGNLFANLRAKKHHDYEQAKNPETQHYAVISAAHDDEPAISTEQGGLFTRGILKVMQQHQESGQALNLKQLQIKVSEYIKQTVQQENLPINHSPQIHGNARLIQQALW